MMSMRCKTCLFLPKSILAPGRKNSGYVVSPLSGWVSTYVRRTYDVSCWRAGIGHCHFLFATWGTNGTNGAGAGVRRQILSKPTNGGLLPWNTSLRVGTYLALPTQYQMPLCALVCSVSDILCLPCGCVTSRFQVRLKHAVTTLCKDGYIHVPDPLSRFDRNARTRCPAAARLSLLGLRGCVRLDGIDEAEHYLNTVLGPLVHMMLLSPCLARAPEEQGGGSRRSPARQSKAAHVLR